jgi:F0F1-type ATP synthase membrane subunit a
MQRIFSTFPNSWPGVGLLLLRFVTAMPLLVATISTWSGFSDPTSLVLRLTGAVSAGLILLGLWTPFAAALQAMIEGWRSFAGGTFDIDHAMHALVGLGLAMLGPGTWSIDARLYGRKRIEVGR